MLTEAADVNGLYEEALFNLKHRKPLPVKGNGMISIAEREQNAKDYYANVRTNVGPFISTLTQLSDSAVALKVLLAWTLSNVSSRPLFLTPNKLMSVCLRVSCSLPSSQVEVAVLHSIQTQHLTDRRPTCYLFSLSWLLQA